MERTYLSRSRGAIEVPKHGPRRRLAERLLPALTRHLWTLLPLGIAAVVMLGGLQPHGILPVYAQTGDPGAPSGSNPCGLSGHVTDGPYARCDCGDPTEDCPVICWWSNSAQSILCEPRQDVFEATQGNLPTCPGWVADGVTEVPGQPPPLQGGPRPLDGDACLPTATASNSPLRGQVSTDAPQGNDDPSGNGSTGGPLPGPANSSTPQTPAGGPGGPTGISLPNGTPLSPPPLTAPPRTAAGGPIDVTGYGYQYTTPPGWFQVGTESLPQGMDTLAGTPDGNQVATMRFTSSASSDPFSSGPGALDTLQSRLAEIQRKTPITIRQQPTSFCPAGASSAAYVSFSYMGPLDRYDGNGPTVPRNAGIYVMTRTLPQANGATVTYQYELFVDVTADYAASHRAELDAMAGSFRFQAPRDPVPTVDPSGCGTT